MFLTKDKQDMEAYRHHQTVTDAHPQIFSISQELAFGDKGGCILLLLPFVAR